MTKRTRKRMLIDVVLVAVVLMASVLVAALSANASQKKAAASSPRAIGSGADVIPPEIWCPPDVSFECDGIQDFGLATATDDLDPNPTITHNDRVIFFNCPFEYTMIRTWTATDYSGNSSSCDQTIIIQDSTPPVLTCPNDTVVGCDELDEAGWPYLHDNCNPSPALQYGPIKVVGYERFHNKVLRTWEATDSCCNLAACQQVVTLVDTIPPLVVCCADDTIPCGWPVVFGELRIEDNCSASQEITIEVASLDTIAGPAGYKYTVTKCWVARDGFGNVSEPSCQSISVRECDGMCTFTMGGWGSGCPGPQQGDPRSTQPGCIRDYYFDQVFPDGVTIGDTAGADTYGAVWTTPGAVEAFLPAGGTPGMLEADLLDPPATPAGVLAGQILALRLNREYSCAGIFADLGIASSGSCYGDYLIPEACGGFAGLTVDQFLAVADRALSGHIEVLEPYGDSLSGLNRTATCLNEQYDGCEKAALAALGLITQDVQPNDASTLVEMSAPAVQHAAASDQTVGSVIYPNPLQASATIGFALRASGVVTVEIFDVRGVKVRTLLNAERPTGDHSVVWDGADAKGNPAVGGLYFCRIRCAGQPTVTEKLVKTE